MLLSVYSAVIAIDLATVPSEVSWSEQFIISNDNVWALIITWRDFTTNT